MSDTPAAAPGCLRSCPNALERGISVHMHRIARDTVHASSRRSYTTRFLRREIDRPASAFHETFDDRPCTCKFVRYICHVFRQKYRSRRLSSGQRACECPWVDVRKFRVVLLQRRILHRLGSRSLHARVDLRKKHPRAFVSDDTPPKVSVLGKSRKYDFAVIVGRREVFRKMGAENRARV